MVVGDAAMNTPPSPANNLPLPQWAYVPGEMAEDDADHDTLWKAKSLVPSRFRDYVPARHPALRYGIALNDRGYFWESQEVLEAVWAAAPPGGRAPGRPRADPAAGLHPDRQCELEVAHSEAACRGKAVGRSAARAPCAQ